MFKVGDRVMVNIETVHPVVANMVYGLIGTIVDNQPDDYRDYIVYIPKSGRDGDRFSFDADQIRRV